MIQQDTWRRFADKTSALTSTMDSSPVASSRNPPQPEGVVVLGSVHKPKQQEDFDCDRTSARTTHKTNLDNDNYQLDCTLERVKFPLAQSATLSSESPASSALPLNRTPSGKLATSINSTDNGHNAGQDHNQLVQPESNIKLKRCKHGRIIIKDLSKKKLPTATANESNLNQIKSTSSNIPPDLASPQPKEQAVTPSPSTPTPPPPPPRTLAEEFSTTTATTKQSIVAITKSPTRSLDDTHAQSPKLPTSVRLSRLEKTSETKNRPPSPLEEAIKRSAVESPRRRRRSKSRSVDRGRKDRFRVRGIVASRYSPSPPPTSSSRRRSSRSTSRSRGRSPCKRYESPSPRRRNSSSSRRRGSSSPRRRGSSSPRRRGSSSPRRRDRSQSRRKRNKRRKRENRRRNAERSRNRTSFTNDSPPRRSRTPRDRRASGSLSPVARGNPNSYEKHRPDYKSSPLLDHSRGRYDGESRFESGRKKGSLYDEIHSRSLLEECKTSAEALEVNLDEKFVKKNQLLPATTSKATTSLSNQSIKLSPIQNQKALAQPPIVHATAQPTLDPIDSSIPPPQTSAAVTPPPLKDTRSNASLRESPPAPSPATPSNNSIASDIYDPEGPVLPISPGDSPPLSPSLSDIDYPKLPVVLRPNGDGKNGEDDVPSSAVELNQQEKYLQKLNRQERVIEEVKIALRPHYQNRNINKEQYKDVLRRAVPKICHSKKGEINPIKIRALVEAYVGKMKHHKF